MTVRTATQPGRKQLAPLSDLMGLALHAEGEQP